LAVEVAHVTNELIDLAEKAELKSQDWARLTNGAAADFALAEADLDRANTDLARAAEEGTECAKALHNQVKKLLDDQKLEDKARSVIDGWEHNQAETLYIDPVTHEIDSVDLALKQVKAELTAGQTEADIAARGARSRRDVKLTVKEVRAAMHYLDKARGLTRTLEAQLGRISSSDQKALKRLRALFG
jgi:hypothetical protein